MTGAISRPALQRWQWPNGLRAVYQFLPGNPVVTTDVWVKAGAGTEPADWAGTAHFLEHLIFKGTDRLPPGEFDRRVERFGGASNAATSHDYARYYLTATVDHTAHLLEDLAELLCRAAIPEAEFGRERDVVLEEIRQAEDNPDWLGYQVLMELVYGDHAYGRPVLGTPEVLLSRSPEDLRRFHAHHYQPHNVCVAIAGGLAAEAAHAAIARAFESFAPPQPCPIALTPPAPVLAPAVKRESLCLPYLEQARLMLAWRLPAAVPLAEIYALEVLSAFLTGGRSSLWVQALREERQWVQAIDCECSYQAEGGLFLVTVWLEGQELARVEAALLESLAAIGAGAGRGDPDEEGVDLAVGSISPAALARAQRLLQMDYLFSTETPSQLAGLFGYYELLDRLDESLTYPERIQAVSTAAIRAAIVRHLSPTAYAVVTLEPL